VRKIGNLKILAFPASPNDIYHIKILGEKVKRVVSNAEFGMGNAESRKSKSFENNSAFPNLKGPFFLTT
jgi:hypothetical protein